MDREGSSALLAILLLLAAFIVGYSVANEIGSRRANERCIALGYTGGRVSPTFHAVCVTRETLDEQLGATQ